jgi:sodium/potassium/calcium exchanger 4
MEFDSMSNVISAPPNASTSLNPARNKPGSSSNFDDNGSDDHHRRFDEPDEHLENFTPFKLPGADQPLIERIKYYSCWPLIAALYYTIPNCRKREKQKLFGVTFFISLIWLSLFSYVMLWMITVIGYTFNVPDTVMGITFIAFGASVPDALGSLLVAKSGLGDMAISNAIGSNIFDILVCLGLPWFLRCLTIDKVDYIIVKSRGLTYASITLFATVIILILSVHLNKWQLDKKLGIFLMIVYFLFIMLSSFYEMNILGANHLPMCLDSKW